MWSVCPNCRRGRERYGDMANIEAAYKRVVRELDHACECLNSERNYVSQDLASKADQALGGLSSVVDERPDDIRDWLKVYHNGLMQFRRGVDSDIEEPGAPRADRCDRALATLILEVQALDEALHESGLTATDPLTGTVPNIDLVKAEEVRDELDELIKQARQVESGTVELDEAISADDSISQRKRAELDEKSNKVKLGLNLFFFAVTWEREVDLISVGRSARKVGKAGVDYAKALPKRIRAPVTKAGAELAAAVTGFLSSATKLLSRSRPPDEETRKRWELEAAVALLTDQPIPRERQPHLRALSLSGVSDALFEALKRKGAPLDDIYVDPEADRLKRRLKLADISALAALTRLQTLVLSYTQVSDIRALAALTGLQSLYLNRTRVSDISALSALTGLQTLNLNGTQVSDIRTLSALTGLQALYLSHTQVSDIRALSALTGLQGLNLISTQVSDIGALSALTGLQWLNLNSTQVSDIGALAALTGLQTLYLNGTQVSDIGALSALTGLQRLELMSTQVSDIRALSALTGLHTLYLSGSQVSDISALAALTGLQRLYLSGTQVSDWSPVDHVDDVPGRPKDWKRKTRG